MANASSPLRAFDSDTPSNFGLDQLKTDPDVEEHRASSSMINDHPSSPGNAQRSSSPHHRMSPPPSAQPQPQAQRQAAMASSMNVSNGGKAAAHAHESHHRGQLAHMASGGDRSLPRRVLVPNAKGATKSPPQAQAQAPPGAAGGGGGRMSISALSEAPFTRFDAQSEIAMPMEENIQEQSDFQKEITSRLLILLLETRAWCDARPRLEKNRHFDELTKETRDVQMVEERQGRSFEFDSSSTLPSSRSSAPHVRFIERYEPILPECTDHWDPDFESTSSARCMEQARQKLTQFVRHFTNAIQALAQSTSNDNCL